MEWIIAGIVSQNKAKTNTPPMKAFTHDVAIRLVIYSSGIKNSHFMIKML
jgi:hypothetical protein